ncbi:hypothetical protein UY3_15767 [Chelonia mydas]|uniref:Myb/SANT-like DNA-binding domain-containing protein n=1 Tax=Chelonia mydas TaxID=8469 RepID=M7B4V5_CHEMY|nr:hypothetical protein UY3_15767 [Chelonia mydas]
MVASCSKRCPTWNIPELLDLLALWGEKAVQSQLCSSHRNLDTYGQISLGLCGKGYEWDTVQCKAKIKELSQACQKAKEVNCHSGADPETCHFCKELDPILGSNPTSTAKSPVDTLVRQEVAESGPNPEDKVVGKEVELEDDVEPTAGLSSGTASQEFFSTLEVSSQSQQSLSGKQEAGEEGPGRCGLKGNLLHTGRVSLPDKEVTKEDIFQEVLQSSEAEKRERREWRETETQDRKDTEENIQKAHEQMIKVMEVQTEKLKSLSTL